MRSRNIGLKLNGGVSFDKLKVAKNFNSFYTIVASKLGKNFVESCYCNNSVFFQIVVHF